MDTLNRDSESTDLSALAWVNEELRRSLDNAHKSLRRFLKEAEAAAGSDVDAVDPSVLRAARNQIHQGVGALEMVGLSPAAALLRASETALQQYIAKPAKLTEAVVDRIEHASFALLDYLARLLANKPVSPLSFFPQYKAVQELAVADRIHPADLWAIEWNWHDLPADPQAEARQADNATRSALECHMLAIMRTPSERSFARMSELCAGLAAGAPVGSKTATLWQLASAVFEAQSRGLLRSDVYSKRLASRLLSQLRILESGGSDVSERLVQDLVFFCAHAGEPAAGQAEAPRLAAARGAWSLKSAPIDYNTATLGKFDPALLVQASKRVVSAKEAWSAVAGGELHRLPGLGEQFALVSDSLRKLFPQGEALAAEMQAAATQSIQHEAAPEPALAMEVATALLYIEACLEDGEVDAPEQGERVRRLAERIKAVRAGHPSAALESWMEDLYRRVSDRQTMGSVVQELRASLSEVEKLVDQFFRQSAESPSLIPVPGLLSSMRGVLSVLGLEQASIAVLRMRDDVDHLMASVDKPDAAALAAPVFERLAANLGALDFLIGMLSVQPQMAKSLFVFDADKGILTPVMGREVPGLGPTSHDTETLPTVEPRLLEQAQMLAMSAARDDVPLEDLNRGLEMLSQEARAAEQLNLVATVSQAKAALAQATDAAEIADAREQLSEALVEFVHSSTDPVGLDEPLERRFEPVPTTEDLTEDDEMREIFLEEAKDVIVDARDAVAKLTEAPGDINLLTTIRRAFHTLKGSSRMVGLNVFGEAAWVGEQLYNARLGDHKPADEPLLNFTRWALQHFDEWVLDIENRTDGQRTHQPVADAARALDSAAPAPAVAAVSGDDESSDVPELPELPDLPDLPGVPETTSSVGTSDFLKIEDRLSLDFSVPDGQAASGESGGEAGQPAAMFPDADDALLADLPADVLSSAESSPLEPSTPAQAEAPVLHTAQVHPPVAEEEEQVKVIGPLKIGIPLFNIYLNEADELSRRLSTALAEWALEHWQPIGDDAIALAHSLAGSSATVGFTSLSGLARSLEHAQMRSQAAGSGTVEEARLFPDVAEEIRSLLHQFAAGFLKDPSPALLERLAQHELSAGRRLERLSAHGELADADGQEGGVDVALDELPVTNIEDTAQATAELALDLDLDVPADVATVSGAALDGPGDLVATQAGDLASAPALDMDLSSDPGAVDLPLDLSHTSAEVDLLLGADELPVAQADPPPPVAAADFRHSSPADFRHSTIEAASLPPLDTPELAELAPMVTFDFEPKPAAHLPDLAGDANDDEDDIDAVDAVDAELFPIFEEEGQELLPMLATQIRDWAREPGVSSHGGACMRTLHTLKGGARLAGAMRLGEMAHRLETRIEHMLGQSTAAVDDIEILNARSDALMHAFEQLRARDQASYNDAVAQAEQAVRNEEVLAPHSPLASLPAVEPVAEPVHVPDLPTASDLVSAPAERAADAARRPPARAVTQIDWSHFGGDAAASQPMGVKGAGAGHAVRVRAPLLDRLVNQAGEVSITRSRIASEVGQLRGSLTDLTDNLERLRLQLRDIELQGETQMASRIEAAKAADQSFDPLEFDRFTRFQELTRMMAESVNDVATVQRTLTRTLDSTDDELAAQGRLARELQDDLLRTRMVEFDSLSDRLYRVVRQASKETGKQVRLDIVGATIEVDRGVLDRMTGAFEHLLRNSVTHGIELPEARREAGKDPIGTIAVTVTQEGNEVAVAFQDDGAGLDLNRIRKKGVAMGLIAPDEPHTDAELANLIFTPGFSTAEKVTELAGRGVGMDVVRSEVNAIGGRIETATAAGQGTSFKLQLPLTTAVTQIVMMRVGDTTVAVPSTMVDLIRRTQAEEIDQAYVTGAYAFGDRPLQFFWLGALLQLSPCSAETTGKTRYVAIIKSAQQRIAVHVDEVLGNQEAVVKNLGPQLARLPGLAGMTLLASGAVALIYNPVALATLYGDQAREATTSALFKPAVPASEQPTPVAPVEPEAAVRVAPLVLVVDDSLTVRRVTQRLLVREGYRVALAKDGLDALEKLAEEKPQIVLSDIEMPRMDGFDLVRNIRGDARLRDLPVIMITSRIAQKHRDYAAELGVDHYLGKPYSEEDLLALIGRYTSAHAIA